MANRNKKGQSKRLPKEVVAMMKGGVALIGIAWKIAKEIIAQGGTWEDVFRLEQPDGAPTIVEMAKCAVVKKAQKSAPSTPQRGKLTTVRYSKGLLPLICEGLGEANQNNVNSNINEERFPLTGTDVREDYFWVEPCRDGETLEQTAARVEQDKTIQLENTAELAAYLHDHPDEVARWAWVFAVGKQSRWTVSGGVRVPYACVDGAGRRFRLGDFRSRYGTGYGVLVSSKSAPT